MAVTFIHLCAWRLADLSRLFNLAGGEKRLRDCPLDSERLGSEYLKILVCGQGLRVTTRVGENETQSAMRGRILGIETDGSTRRAYGLIKVP